MKKHLTCLFLKHLTDLRVGVMSLICFLFIVSGFSSNLQEMAGKSFNY